MKLARCLHAADLRNPSKLSKIGRLAQFFSEVQKEILGCVGAILKVLAAKGALLTPHSLKIRQNPRECGGFDEFYIIFGEFEAPKSEVQN